MLLINHVNRPQAEDFHNAYCTNAGSTAGPIHYSGPGLEKQKISFSTTSHQILKRNLMQYRYQHVNWSFKKPQYIQGAAGQGFCSPASIYSVDQCSWSRKLFNCPSFSKEQCGWSKDRLQCSTFVVEQCSWSKDLLQRPEAHFPKCVSCCRAQTNFARLKETQAKEDLLSSCAVVASKDVDQHYLYANPDQGIFLYADP